MLSLAKAARRMLCFARMPQMFHCRTVKRCSSTRTSSADVGRGPLPLGSPVCPCAEGQGWEEGLSPGQLPLCWLRMATLLLCESLVLWRFDSLEQPPAEDVVLQSNGELSRRVVEQ